MKIAIGSDEKTSLTDAIVKELGKRGHKLSLHGALTKDEPQWPYVGEAVAEQVAKGAADEGVLFCWTGTGVCIAANKVPGIRAALCIDADTARGARKWDHANVLAMSLRSTPEPIAKEILDAWFSTKFSQEKSDLRAVARIKAIEQKYAGKRVS